MRLMNIIKEGLSDVLYHSTEVGKATSMLSNDRFRLTPAIGIGSEMDIIAPKERIEVGDIVYIATQRSDTLHKVISKEDDGTLGLESMDKYQYVSTVPERQVRKQERTDYKKRRKNIYYMSFSRNKSDDYRRLTSDRNIGGDTTLVINGRQLSQDGYSGRAIDYWGPTFRRDITKLPLKDEMEDRLFYDKPHIENASKYVQEIHVYMGTSPDDRLVRKLRKIKLVGSRKNIPVFLYDSFKEYNLLTKREGDRSILKRRLEPEERRMSYPARNIFAPHIELLMTDDYENLSTEAKREYRTLVSIDGVRPLSADIHNSRTNPQTRPMLDRFISHLQDKNIGNLEEYKRYIEQKFKY